MAPKPRAQRGQSSAPLMRNESSTISSLRSLDSLLLRIGAAPSESLRTIAQAEDPAGPAQENPGARCFKSAPAIRVGEFPGANTEVPHRRQRVPPRSEE